MFRFSLKKKKHTKISISIQTNLTFSAFLSGMVEEKNVFFFLAEIIFVRVTRFCYYGTYEENGKYLFIYLS